MWTDILAPRFRDFIVGARTDLVVFAPYMSVSALANILDGCRSERIAIVTRWSAMDVLRGAADLHLYAFAKERQANLLVLPRLHMKALVSDFSRAVVSTANMTGRGLGLIGQGNIECAVRLETLSSAEALWFAQLMRDAILVQDDYYGAFEKHVLAQEKIGFPPVDRFDNTAFRDHQAFLLSSLPQSQSPSALLDALHGTSLDAATLHDAALFRLDLDEDRNWNEQKLAEQFRRQAFTRAFLEFAATGKYFGECKRWLQHECADLPPPCRRDLTGYMRILFDWSVELSGGAYAINRPHHSEQLSLVASAT